MPGQPQKLFLPPAGPGSQLASWVFAARFLCLVVEIAFFFAVIYLMCSSAAKEEAGGDVCESCGLFSGFFPKEVLGVSPGWAETRFVMERGAAEPRSSETRAWGSRFPSTENLGSLRI